MNIAPIYFAKLDCFRNCKSWNSEQTLSRYEKFENRDEKEKKLKIVVTVSIHF